MISKVNAWNCVNKSSWCNGSNCFCCYCYWNFSRFRDHMNWSGLLQGGETSSGSVLESSFEGSLGSGYILCVVQEGVGKEEVPSFPSESFPTELDERWQPINVGAYE